MINIPILSSIIPSVNDTFNSEGKEVKGGNNPFFKILQDINSEQAKNINSFMKKAPKDTGSNLFRYYLDNKGVIQEIFQQNPLMIKDLFNNLQEKEEVNFSKRGEEDQEVLNFLGEVLFLKSGLKETGEMTELIDGIFDDSKGFLGKSSNLGTKDFINLKGIQENLKRLLIKEFFVPLKNKGGETQRIIEKLLQGLKILDGNAKNEIADTIEKKEGLSLKDLLMRIGVLSEKEKKDGPLKEIFNQKDSISDRENMGKLEEPSLFNKSTGLSEGALDENRQILLKDVLNNGSSYFEQNLDIDTKPIQNFQFFVEGLDIDPKVISYMKEIMSKKTGTEFEHEFQKNGLSLVSELEIKSKKIDHMDKHHRDMDMGFLHKEGSMGEIKGTFGRLINKGMINKFHLDNQIINQIIDKMKKPIFKDGKNEIKLSLKPEFLGKLKMDISVEKNILRADVTVENHFIKDVLDGNIDKLKQALQPHGIEIREFSVSVGQDHGQQATNRNSSNNSKVIFDLPREKLGRECNHIPSNMITQRGIIDILI